MRSWLHGVLRRTNVHGCVDLPMAVAPQPSVYPNEPPALTAAPLPGLVPLGDRGLSIESHLYLVEVIRDKELWCLPRLRNHRGFVVNSALRVNSDEVVGQDAFEHRRVASSDGLSPLPLTQSNVLLRLALLVMRRALTKRQADKASNGETF